MITRVWKGTTRVADAKTYLGYMERTGLRELRGTPGNLGVACLRRVSGERAEFVVVSLWDSRDSIRAFAGEEIDVAVFYPDDERFLVQRELSVTHYDVVFEDVPLAPVNA